MRNIFITRIILFSLLSINIHCQRELFFNKPPVAVAGPDKSFILPVDSIVLDGSASSDSDGRIISYSWKNITSSFPCLISNISGSRTGVKNFIEGVYFFELKVTDNENESAKDTVKIVIINSGPPPPPVVTKPIKVTVLEFGTNQPIDGASVKMCLSPSGAGCTGAYTYFTTSSSGETIFSTNKYRYGGATKNGYWSLDYSSCFIKYYNDDPVLAAQGIHTSDSVIVKLVKQEYALLHVRDSSGVGHDVNLYREGYFDFCSYYPFEIIPMRQNIDTTFTYLVFGNVNNLFTIADLPDTTGNQTQYFQNMIYMPSPGTVHIVY